MLIIVFLVVSALLGGKNVDVEKIVEDSIAKNLGSINRDTTTISNPHTFQQGVTINVPPAGGNSLTVDGKSTLTGTTTITKSPDGFVAYMGFTVATGTAKASYSNPSNDMVCDGSSGYFQGIGTTFAPSLVVAFGTSTSATGYSTNLLASTTLATTTNQFFAETYTSPFRLKSGESIVGALSDITNTDASSTYYSNWSMEYGVHCWTMGF